MALAFASSALAGSISGGTSLYVYTATAGEANQITVQSISPTQITIEEDGSGAAITESSSTCTRAANVVTCTINASGATPFTWNLGDNTDSLNIADDVLTRDTVNPGTGMFDVVSCGGAFDYVSYSDRTAAVSVTPNDSTDNDGEVDEYDNVDGNCEGSIGGSGNDQLHAASDSTGGLIGNNGNDLLVGGDGNAASCYASTTDPATRLDGGNGNDVINALSGSNYLAGGAGDDVLSGGPGCDILYDHTGNDVMDGGAGNDILQGGAETGYNNIRIGGPGEDVIYDSGGNDTIITADGGYDEYQCEGFAGTNRVVVDSNDYRSYGSDADCDTIVNTN